jgi:hypothetical protein
MTTLARIFRGPAAIAALLALACQTASGPTHPAPSTPQSRVELVRFLPSHALQPAGETAGRVSVLTGATITNDDATLVVPPMSVPNGTTITIATENDGTVTFRFGPNGLQFAVPATLKISTAHADLSGIDPADLRIAGASDDGDDWTVVGGVYDPVTGTVAASISHFSRYALCTD